MVATGMLVELKSWSRGSSGSQAASAKKKGQKVSKADVAIGKICKPYAIEDRVKDLTPEQKDEPRQTPGAFGARGSVVETTTRPPASAAGACPTGDRALPAGSQADRSLRKNLPTELAQQVA